MKLNLPGTVLDFPYIENGDYFGIVSPVFYSLSGITLGQIKEITGLSTATIQNWVKRGYIPAPVGRRYEKRHLLRILLVNSIKGGLKIEDVQDIMVYINGDVEDTSDDIVSDEDLYNFLCRVIKICEGSSLTDQGVIGNAVDSVLESYSRENESFGLRLKKALCIMVTAYVSARLREVSEKGLSEILSQEERNG